MELFEEKHDINDIKIEINLRLTRKADLFQINIHDTLKQIFKMVTA